MADRYWVATGATEYWDTDPGTKWAATSGGAGGESVPTLADTVYFNGDTGTNTVIVQNNNSSHPGYRTAANIYFTNFSGTFDSVSTSTRVEISGDLTLSSGMTYLYDGEYNFLGSGTLISSGHDVGDSIFVSGSSANLSLGDALTTAYEIVPKSGGVFNASGYSVGVNRILVYSGSTFNCDSSTISLSGGANTTWQTSVLTVYSGGTFNGGTSTLVPMRLLSSYGYTRIINDNETPINLYNVEFLSQAGSQTLRADQAVLVDGPFNFNNIDLSNIPASTGYGSIKRLFFTHDSTISGTLTCTGQNHIARTMLAAGTYDSFEGRKEEAIGAGNPVTLTVASLNSSYTDFRDITLAGAASGASPTNAGDCGGNTGINFPASKTVYTNGTGTYLWNDIWATSSGGTPSLSNFPLPQDKAVINTDYSGGSTRYATYYVSYNYGEIDASTATGFTLRGQQSCGLILYSGLTLSSSGDFSTTFSDGVFFVGRGASTLTSAGKLSSTYPVTMGCRGGSLELADALACGDFYIYDGTLNTNNYDVTLGNGDRFQVWEEASGASGAVVTLNLGSSTISGTLIYIREPSTTLNASNSTFTITGAGSVISNITGAITLNNIYYTDGGASSRSLRGSGVITCNNLSGAATGDTVAYIALYCPSGITVNNTLTLSGASARQRGGLFSYSSDGSNVVITSSSAVVDNCDFHGITMAGGASGIAPANAGDLEYNSGIVFPAPKTVYRVTTETGWGGVNSWATSSGGAGSDNNFPLVQDTVIIDDGCPLTGVLNVNSSFNKYYYGSLDCSNRTLPLNLNYGADSYHFGDYTLSSGITISGSNYMRAASSGEVNIVTAGVSMPRYLSQAPINIYLGYTVFPGILNINDAWNGIDYSFLYVQYGGTINVKNNLTVRYFQANNTNTSTLNMGSGLWTLFSNSTVWNVNEREPSGITINVQGANILLNNADDNSTRYFAHNYGGAETGILNLNKLTIGNETATGCTTILRGRLSIGELASVKTVAHAIDFQGALTNWLLPYYKIDTWSVSGTSGNLVTVEPVSLDGNAVEITVTNQTKPSIDYLQVQYIEEQTSGVFYVGDNSVDLGNNINVIFTAAPAPPITSNMMMLFD